MVNQYRCNRGISLVVVLVAMMVLTVLGFSFLTVSGFQTQHARIHDEGIRASYLARAGAEAGLDVWQSAPADTKPAGPMNPVYLGADGKFSAIESNNKGQFQVTVSTAGTNTSIRSVGKAGKTEKESTVTISFITSLIPNPISVVNGHDLGFYDYKSGQINPGNWPVSSHGSKLGVVKNEAKNGKGLKLPNQNSLEATLDYERSEERRVGKECRYRW